MYIKKEKVKICVTYLILIGSYFVIISTNAVILKPTEQQIIIRCQIGTNDTIQSMTPLTDKESATVIAVAITNCPPVNYAKELAKLNINVQAIQFFALGTKRETDELAAEHLDGLDLNLLSLASYHNLRDDFINPLKTMKNYGGSDLILPKLPDTHNIIHFAVEYGKFKDNWGFCGNIETIYLKHFEIPEHTGSWLAGCPKLRSLKIEDMKADNLSRALNGIRDLPYLTIANSFFSQSTWDGEVSKGVAGLLSLNLSQAGIEYITSNAFERHPNLKVLDLSRNRIDFDKFKKSNPLAKLSQLKSLTLDGNEQFRDICTTPQTKWRVKIPAISLSNVGLSSLCFGKWKGIFLLDLSNNNIQILNFTELPRPKEGYMTVDLRNNPITNLSFTEEDFKVLTKKYATGKGIMISIDPMQLDCDCQNGWLARMMRSLPIFIENATCPSGRLNNQSVDQIECYKYECHPCICRQHWNNRRTTAECSSKELQSIPQLTNVSRLYLRYNFIDSLEPDDFPDHLEFADLRNNLISHLSRETAESIFNLPTRHILLAGNPLLCTCKSLISLTALHNYSSQVEDFDNLTCSNDGRFIKVVKLDELCLEDEEHLYATTPLIPILFAVVSFQVFIVFMCHVNRKNIAVYLYSKGLCLSCFSEKEIHGERDFDAFLSFCHLDDDFVTENILPGIEDYNLCIHYRDWVGGEWIPRQIAESIARSHRTIIILSRNFVNSSWGMLEFRLAHAAMLKEGCRRLVTVVIDDVVTEPTLDAELQTYLLSNTYVKWGDPWFFKKLRYALPRKNDDPDDEDTYGIEMDNLRAASQNYRPRRLAITGNYDRDFSQNTNYCNQLVLVT